jgi:hypothetical protein
MIDLIRQAIRELHIDIEPHNATLDVTPVLAPQDKVGWTNQKRRAAEPQDRGRYALS